jgi:hypothetical protein
MELMANSAWRIPFKNAVISSNAVPTSGAGSNQNDPLRNGGLNAVNLWGTGKGQGVPANYAMLALDGDIVAPVNIVTTAVKENDPIYITSGNALTNVSTSNTLYGYADEPGAVNAATVIGVRISNAVGA